MKFVHDDGGRVDAGFKGTTGDCAVRAICVAGFYDYEHIYNDLNRFIKDYERSSKRRKSKSSSRTGVYTATFKRYLESLRWKWQPTMGIGTGCQVHLKADELPKGRIIVNVSKHFTAVIDGVLHDTYDCSRNGTRCVYGYWYR